MLHELQKMAEASACVDLPLLASEAFSRGLQEGTKAIVHCCICGAGTQWNASSMVFIVRAACSSRICGRNSRVRAYTAVFLLRVRDLQRKTCCVFFAHDRGSCVRIMCSVTTASSPAWTSRKACRGRGRFSGAAAAGGTSTPQSAGWRVSRKRGSSWRCA